MRSQHVVPKLKGVIGVLDAEALIGHAIQR